MDRPGNLGFDSSKMSKVAADDYSSSDSDDDDDEYLMPSRDPQRNEFRDFNPESGGELEGTQKKVLPSASLAPRAMMKNLATSGSARRCAAKA